MELIEIEPLSGDANPDVERHRNTGFPAAA
jgi:hypothetical protein